jgi:formate hydrogenlyase subunit 3/multisubunit Na+/H+ antiporter MnhD subunit
MESAPASIPWVAWLILVPLLGAVACLIWPRQARYLGFLTLVSGLLGVAGLGMQLLEHGVYRHAIGAWGVPLGIDLYADGLSLWMLAMVALVGLGVSLYATAYFEAPRAAHFWPLWLFLLAALNALFLSRDLFNLYVNLEMIGLAAVALTALQGGSNALVGAMRYLLATLLGSLAYLMGVVLLYHGYGTVDIALLGERITAAPVAGVALGLMTAGLALKTALFPLHFWLPPAHASAPAAVSALLSALVIKASFYILLRLWLDVFPSLSAAGAQLLGVLGVAAVLWGSFQALQQTRVKLLVAYSTVAQVGYLFLGFPLAASIGSGAWSAVAYLAFSHALAKAAMFLAAGNFMLFGGHDRIGSLDRVVQRLPLSAGAFALAGVSIMGLPPSGGFNGKWLLLQAAVTAGRWDLVVVMLAGGILAAAYVFKVLGHTFTQADVPHEPRVVPARMEWAAMLLACGAIVAGFLAAPMLAMLAIGEPFAVSGVSP